MTEEVEAVKRSMRSEIVPYGAYEPDLGDADEPGSVRIPVERRRRSES
jgi:hypothetical protein